MSKHNVELLNKSEGTFPCYKVRVDGVSLTLSGSNLRVSWVADPSVLGAMRVEGLLTVSRYAPGPCDFCATPALLAEIESQS